jgi:hypothetical protein
VLLGSLNACSKYIRKPEPEPTPSPDSAAVDRILDRYTKAIGGEEAIYKAKSYKVQGTFAITVLKVRGTFEVWGKDPDKTLSILTFPQSIVVKKGFDGETRWLQTPAGTTTGDGSNEMAEVERDADVYRGGRLKNLYQSMHLEGHALIQGHATQVIEGRPARGPSDKLFFDNETGLLLRWDMIRRNPKGGNVFVKVHLDDYRDVDGVKVPFKVRFAFESFDLIMNIDELKHNVAIDDSIFKKPS